ncbi:hypothetical protein VPNG_02777 [Cytospora leucostoma]|uniref:Uncharacterized protein n=1 Tax=Cytospora leucostoma TaxID=1230097 RepID=A0A423XJX1_9PEZI|nr:hypothetical protein VPNG_02777 [Cytospora leucostoma]
MAPIALAAPLSPKQTLLLKNLDGAVLSDPSSQAIGSKPPATITIEGSQTILLGPQPKWSDLEDATIQVTDDNRPVVLSPSQLAHLPASSVLSSTHPLTTEHLQALSRLLQSEQARSQQEAARPEPSSTTRRKMPVGSLVAPGSSPAVGVWNAQKVLVQMDDDTRVVMPPQQRQIFPCERQQAGVLVIGMALTFVLVILLVEKWEPVSRGVYRALGRREGAIRLMEDKNGLAGRRGLSFGGVDPEDCGTTLGQKSEVQWGRDGNVGEKDYGAEPWILS